MGHICDELFLILLGCVDLARHVVERGGEVAHLVLGIHAHPILHVPGCVLLRRPCDAPERHIDQLREENENDHGEQKEHDQLEIRNVEELIDLLVHIVIVLCDADIAADAVVAGNGGEHRQSVLVVFPEEMIDKIIPSPRCDGRIEIMNVDFPCRIRRGK